MKNASSLYNEIAELHNVSPESVKKVEMHIFDFIADHMKKRHPSPILIHNFGTFCPSLNKTRREINKILYKWRKGMMEREDAVKKISALWILRNEALKQKND